MKTIVKTSAVKSAAVKPSKSRATAAIVPKWKLLLYVADGTSKSIAAFENLKELCEEHLAGNYHIEVIDLVKNPKLAQGDQILALPTVVRKLPAPVRKIIGSLADTERVLVGLDLRLHQGRRTGAAGAR